MKRLEAEGSVPKGDYDDWCSYAIRQIKPDEELLDNYNTYGTTVTHREADTVTHREADFV